MRVAAFLLMWGLIVPAVLITAICHDLLLWAESVLVTVGDDLMAAGDRLEQRYSR